MFGCYNQDPNDVVPIGFVVKMTDGPLMVLGFVVFNNVLSVIVRNMNNGKIIDFPYALVVDSFKEHEKACLWT